MRLRGFRQQALPTSAAAKRLTVAFGAFKETVATPNLRINVATATIPRFVSEVARDYLPTDPLRALPYHNRTRHNRNATIANTLALTYVLWNGQLALNATRATQPINTPTITAIRFTFVLFLALAINMLNTRF